MSSSLIKTDAVKEASPKMSAKEKAAAAFAAAKAKKEAMKAGAEGKAAIEKMEAEKAKELHDKKFSKEKKRVVQVVAETKAYVSVLSAAKTPEERKAIEIARAKEISCEMKKYDTDYIIYRKNYGMVDNNTNVILTQ